MRRMWRRSWRSMKRLFLQVGNSTIELFWEMCLYCSFNRKLSASAADAARNPKKIKWSTVAYYMDTCGSDAVPIVGLLGFLIGVILAFQAIMQLGRYGVESYVVNLVGTVIVTELAPLVTAVVLAGRTGSAFAAELGSMKASEELDAMVTMGFDTGRFLLFPKLLALLLVMPGLTLISDACGIVGGLVIVTAKLDVTTAEYVSKTFEVVKTVDMMQGLVKSFMFALIIVSVGCMKGFNAERDAQGVGKSATSAVVTSIFLIVVFDALITSIFGIST